MSKVEIIQDKAAFETTDVVSDHHYFILEMDLRIRKKFDLENLYLIASKTKISIFFSNRPSVNLEEVLVKWRKKISKNYLNFKKVIMYNLFFQLKILWPVSGSRVRSSGQVRSVLADPSLM